MNSKKCFVIAPIGKENSDVRKRSDQVYAHIIEPIAQACGYEVTRADKISKPGQISTQIIKHLVEDDLVIADLTGHNPNVFYELAVRHSASKPVIQIIAVGEILPFDVSQSRSIFFDYKDLDSTDKCKNEIKEQITAIERDPSDIDNPVLTVIDLGKVRGSDNPLERVTVNIFAKITDLTTKLDGMYDSLAAWRTIAGSELKHSGVDAQARYIDGETEAFAALTEVTKQAKQIVRSTRFFPDSVLKQPAYVSAMEQRILGTDGNPALLHYYRIVALNNPEKLRDINHHLNTFFGHPFDLYLTTNQNTFELVIVDDTDAFIHFHKEEKVIASTLHIKGKSVVQEFIEIFNKLKSRDLVKEFNCRDIAQRDLIKHLQEVDKIFQEKFDGPGATHST